MNKIITIGREFGSGGREFGRRLSEALGIAYYDQEIVSEIAKRTSLSEQYIQSISEHQNAFSFPIHVGRSFAPTLNQLLEQSLAVYQEQAEILQEMAEKSDCVIVGRCADYVLKDYHPLRIFVYADLAHKLRRCREKAPEGESLSDRELKQKMNSIDKKRARYYEFYTGHSWGDKLNFDICLNTTNLVIRDIVPAFAKLLG